MTEQIIINGQIMDTAEGKTVSLVYQSPLFTDIDSIVSNRTNSVDLPATKHNLAVVGNPHITGLSSSFAYHKHKVVYMRDGVQVFSGYGTLLGVTSESLKMTFAWGNISTFKRFLDCKLHDLKHQFNQEDIRVPWDNTAVQTNAAHYAANLQTGQYPHPFIMINDILGTIERNMGVTIEGKERFRRYCLPVLGNKADDFAKKHQGVMLSTNLYQKVTDTQYWYNLAVGAGDKDIQNRYMGNGLYDVKGCEKVRIIIGPGGYQYYMPAYHGKSEQQINIYATTEDGLNRKQLSYIRLYKTGGAEYCYSTVEPGQPASERVIDVDVTGYSRLSITICEVGKAQTASAPYEILGFIDIIPDFDKEQDLIFGGVFPIYKNLPDWTVAQLLKNLMKLEGLFAVCPDDHTVRLMSYDDIFARRKNAIDVTDKLILQDSQPLERTFRFGSFAQRNACKYADDKTVSVDANGVLEIRNDNLELSKDLLKVDFAATDEDQTNVYIGLYSYDKGEYKYNEVKPRILKFKEGVVTQGLPYLTFTGFDWESLLQTNYSRYKACVEHPTILKASVMINAVELAELDLTRPVYSYTLSRYYVITKLTTKGDNMADVELLELVDRSEAIPEEPPVLTVVSDGKGGYMATLANKSEMEISRYNADPNVKVCLIRHGYARRGKFFTYVDHTGKATNSKTCRTVFNQISNRYPGWRGVRRESGGGTPCWRIIGQEILDNGTLAYRSQTKKKYGDCSLVFDLHQPMTLPAIPRRALTKSGRIGNRASDGIAELSIAMYRKNAKGKWKRISNICPVRSRTVDKLLYWDFEPRNTKAL